MTGRGGAGYLLFIISTKYDICGGVILRSSSVGHISHTKAAIYIFIRPNLQCNCVEHLEKKVK